jgi:hypothetical protein
VADFAVTEAGTWQRCARQAVLTSKNAMYLEPAVTPLSLSLGTLWHRGHQLWLLDPETTLYQHMLNAGNELLEKSKRRYRERVGVFPSRAELEIVYESLHFALAMAENYQTRYITPLPDDYQLLAPEQKFRVPVPGTEHDCETCEEYTGPGCPDCEGTGTALHHLRGRLDALVQHSSGRVDILERKSYGRRPDEHGLRFNVQFTAYKWGVGQLGVNNHLDSCILYDGAWRRDKVPRGKTFNDLFFRTLLTRNAHQMEEFARELPTRLNAMYELYTQLDPLAVADTHRPWLGCHDCRMVKLCDALTLGEDTQTLMRTDYQRRTDDDEEATVEAE